MRDSRTPESERTEPQSAREDLIQQIAAAIVDQRGMTVMNDHAAAGEALDALDRLGYEIVPRGLVAARDEFRSAFDALTAGEPWAVTRYNAATKALMEAAVALLDKETTDG